MTDKTLMTLFKDDIKDIKADVKSLLKKMNEDKIEDVKECNKYRQEFNNDLSAVNTRVNKLFTIGGVALFLFGIAIKQGWV